MGGAESDKRANEILEQTLLPVVRNMAEAIFTTDRVQQLITALKEYRSQRFAERDNPTVGQAQGAINYLEREDSPGENSFLIALCWSSLMRALEPGAVESSATGARPAEKIDPHRIEAV